MLALCGLKSDLIEQLKQSTYLKKESKSNILKRVYHNKNDLLPARIPDFKVFNGELKQVFQ
jgi:hypothetical protein